MSRMSFSARLSVAPTVKVKPFPMSWVSGLAAVAPLPLLALSAIVGGMRSFWKPPGLGAASHAHPASARTHIPHRIATARPCRIETPGLLPGAGRHQVVDDVRRDENQQV